MLHSLELIGGRITLVLVLNNDVIFDLTIHSFVPDSGWTLFQIHVVPR